MGVLTGLIDVGKGILIILMVRSFSDSTYLLVLCSFLVIVDHNYSIYLGFKDGRGLATTFGVIKLFIILFPLILLWAVIFALLLTFILCETNTAFGYATFSLPILLIFLTGAPEWILFGVATALVITLKHMPDFMAYQNGHRKLL
ncbi:MAG: glycerol-3-phosphate acyltransferase [Bacillota bacterium]|nr:glycerol-3-phosphate acyltransferase [Bacillota bacterium]